MKNIFFTVAMAGVANGIPWACGENEILAVDDGLADEIVALGRGVIHDPLNAASKPKTKAKAKDTAEE